MPGAQTFQAQLSAGLYSLQTCRLPVLFTSYKEGLLRQIPNRSHNFNLQQGLHQA